MPSQLSKFFVEATCREYAHPWTDSCVSTTAGLGLHALQESFRIYSTVYLFTLLMRGKVPTKNEVLKTIAGIIQSTAFLAWSGFSYSMFICLLRNYVTNYNFLTVSFLPSFLSSLTAIILERPSRRTLLCLYVSNIATETLFRMGVWRGYFNVIPRGEVYIFAASMSTLLYFYRLKDNKKEQINRIFRFLIGKYEEANYQLASVSQETPSTSRSNNNWERPRRPKGSSFNIIWESLKVYQSIINKIKLLKKHSSCPHPHSCAHYFLSGGLKQFSIGLVAQIGIKLLLQARSAIRKKGSIKDIIFQRNNLNLPLFLGGFTGLYRLVSCLLRTCYNKDSPYFAIPASAIASTSFILFPNNTVALYVMWKALQLSWNNGVENEKVPEVKWFVIFLYSFSTAVLFHAAIVEPQNLRNSYWKFLHNISGGRIAAMSRIPLDEFGMESTKHLANILKATKTTARLNYSF